MKYKRTAVRGRMLLFSINTLPTPSHKRTLSAVRLALNVLVVGLSTNVFVLFPLIVAAQSDSCLQVHNMLPSPPLSWHFTANREWCPHICVWVGTVRLKEKVVLWMRSAPGLFFPFMSAYLFMSFHFSSIRTVCVVGGVRVRVLPIFIFCVTLLPRRTPSTWAESRACCDCAWALICQALIPQRRRDVSFCLLALLHISMWHINMSQRIKCCSRSFLSPKYLHAALCMCIFVCQGGKLAN